MFMAYTVNKGVASLILRLHSPALVTQCTKSGCHLHCVLKSGAWMTRLDAATYIVKEFSH